MPRLVPIDGEPLGSLGVGAAARGVNSAHEKAPGDEPGARKSAVLQSKYLNRNVLHLTDLVENRENRRSYIRRRRERAARRFSQDRELTLDVTGHFKTSHFGSVQNQPLRAAGF